MRQRPFRDLLVRTMRKQHVSKAGLITKLKGSVSAVTIYSVLNGATPIAKKGMVIADALNLNREVASDAWTQQRKLDPKKQFNKKREDEFTLLPFEKGHLLRYRKLSRQAKSLIVWIMAKDIKASV